MNIRQFSVDSWRKQNWALIVGALLVGFMTLVAIMGPVWAPHDPMQENYTLAVDGSIRTPPYPAFKLEGYPLGTDRWGRDLWSRILWGVRPTMIMVVSVAGFRLAVGILVGLLIGWADGRKARILDSIISSLLSVPVLIVALIGIYAVGTDRGLWAFIFGLGLTGWAETARMVSEQTRLIKRQAFVEAARALGAGEHQILFHHILRHVMSLAWVLLAFEISSTLLVAAELGFLGFFIGGGVWIQVYDFVSVHVEGLPELGQMLSSALVKITDPSALLIVGTFIFMGVLGFNLLGEGLRIELTQKEFGRRVGLMPRQAGEWIDIHIRIPFRHWMELYGRIAATVVLFVSMIAGAWIYYDRNQHVFTSNETVLDVPGGHLWAAESHDAYGTLWVPFSMETQPELKWQAQIPGGPSGGPVVSADGVVVIAGKGGTLAAFSPQGGTLWEAPLDAQPIGAPAIDAASRIFVADIEGHVTAFDMQGNRLWRVEASATRQATSGPIVGSNGMIYLTLIDAVGGISPDGVLTWRVTASNIFVDVPPRLSADESLVYLKDAVLDAKTGKRQEIQVRPQAEILFSEPAFFTGVDGLNYYRAGHEVMQWRMTESGLQVGRASGWEAQSFVLFNPRDAGVTSNGLTWLFYSTDFEDARMVWLDRQGRLIGNYNFPYGFSRLIAVGEKGEAYLCGPTGARIACAMTLPGSDEAQWSVMIDTASKPIGGALVPGTLYVAVDGDSLYALSVENGD